MSVDTIDITKLSPAQLNAVLQQARQLEKDGAEERRQYRARGKEFCSTMVGFLADPSTQLPEGPVGDSGAIGWTLGGKDIVVILPDGSRRMARVSVQVRWEDTIPAKGK